MKLSRQQEIRATNELLAMLANDTQRDGRRPTVGEGF
jgi:hypothetical protein